ncbi:hypothetical protein [Streptomyces scopuliridis]|uniref:hypothetical protein n=1 Tax=Streptomyces scopuliridis TaxID=452529 RepID=UPI003693AEF9
MQMKAQTAVAVATLALSAGLVAVPSATADSTPRTTVSAQQAGADVTAVQSPRQDTSASQNCWYGGTHTINGGKMQYHECRRTYMGRTQSSIKIRVQDTRTDGYCVRGRGDIGNSASTAGRRVYVTDCTTNSSWSAWKQSGWWNGNQGYEYVYRVAG